MVPPIRRPLSSGRVSPFRRRERRRMRRASFEVWCVGRFCAAGLSFLQVSVSDRTSHPSGSRRWNPRGEDPSPWRQQAPQRVLRLSRPCPHVRGSGCGLPRRAPSLAGSRSTRSSSQRHTGPGRVHSGTSVCPAPILAPVPATLMQIACQGRRGRGRA